MFFVLCLLSPLKMTSSRPYLLRALYEWIVDNGFTPHLLVDAEQRGVNVPSQYIKEGRIVLNISPTAAQRLEMKNEGISFLARFSGASFSVFVPTGAVLAIYARENGQGMVFSPEEQTDDTPTPSPDSPPPPPKRPVLKRVK